MNKSSLYSLLVKIHMYNENKILMAYLFDYVIVHYTLRTI